MSCTYQAKRFPLGEARAIFGNVVDLAVLLSEQVGNTNDSCKKKRSSRGMAIASLNLASHFISGIRLSRGKFPLTAMPVKAPPHE